MGSAVITGAREPALIAELACLALAVSTLASTANLYAVAINADDKAAVVAHPVEVEQRRVAHVTHLSHPLHCPLPHHLSCT